MINIPAALFTKYTLTLNKKSVPVSVHNNYKKWLRFYLDFCHKYCHRYADRESLNQFMIKLHEKNQSPTMQEEAAKAVRIYYEMLETTPHLPPLHTPLTRGEREGLRGEGTIKVEDSANFTTPPDPLFTKEGVTKSGELSMNLNEFPRCWREA